MTNEEKKITRERIERAIIVTDHICYRDVKAIMGMIDEFISQNYTPKEDVEEIKREAVTEYYEGMDDILRVVLEDDIDTRTYLETQSWKIKNRMGGK